MYEIYEYKPDHVKLILLPTGDTICVTYKELDFFRKEGLLDD